MARYYGVKSRVIAKREWTCTGCDRERPASSVKYIITEGHQVVALLCAFCMARPEPEVSVEAGDDAAQSGGVEDPFEWEGGDVEKAWEEVFGGCAESAAKELAGGNPAVFPQSSRTEREAGLTLESPNPQG